MQASGRIRPSVRVGASIAAAFVVGCALSALVASFYLSCADPGAVPPTGAICIDGLSYNFSTVPVPPYGTNSSSPETAVLHGYEFSLWVPAVQSAGGRQVSANVTGPDGTHWGLTDGEGPPGGGWYTALTPDHRVGLQWENGASVLRLLVLSM